MQKVKIIPFDSSDKNAISMKVEGCLIKIKATDGEGRKTACFLDASSAREVSRILSLMAVCAEAEEKEIIECDLE